ncbi:uncharacterized protein L969DRAFT_105890 [Mixia osmundae IAM 14324]|uniref:Uncharacterized protein n=1 Tax=Mixia osmundae (strain CBS 9802 / IAM 14324 / JCM 22182 / KY 12970) TaxID=764103 RepID=G7DWB1_MIXOS|nr:uncharacterized protein L969DRAFT_105890 [Mixia osmundae IAM 14324]KEI36501.1 hypothetical protein L969DRAFT_105890 [Mixia osmundae IAM 14324]GAA94799.1 hypothetical protein E5Q_01453 [Mixia osmundae IAM 14324]
MTEVDKERWFVCTHRLPSSTVLPTNDHVVSILLQAAELLPQKKLQFEQQFVDRPEPGTQLLIFLRDGHLPPDGIRYAPSYVVTRTPPTGMASENLPMETRDELRFGNADLEVVTTHSGFLPPITPDRPVDPSECDLSRYRVRYRLTRGGMPQLCVVYYGRDPSRMANALTGQIPPECRIPPNQGWERQPMRRYPLPGMDMPQGSTHTAPPPMAHSQTQQRDQHAQQMMMAAAAKAAPQNGASAQQSPAVPTSTVSQGPTYSQPSAQALAAQQQAQQQAQQMRYAHQQELQRREMAQRQQQEQQQQQKEMAQRQQQEVLQQRQMQEHLLAQRNAAMQQAQQMSGMQTGHANPMPMQAAMTPQQAALMAAQARSGPAMNRSTPQQSARVPPSVQQTQQIAAYREQQQRQAAQRAPLQQAQASQAETPDLQGDARDLWTERQLALLRLQRNQAMINPIFDAHSTQQLLLHQAALMGALPPNAAHAPAEELLDEKHKLKAGPMPLDDYNTLRTQSKANLAEKLEKLRSECDVLTQTHAARMASLRSQPGTV